MPAFGVVPRDRALDVADEVARPALEALLVVEDDATVGRGHEQVRRAGDDATARRAIDALATVDDDVRIGRDIEHDGLHPIAEAHRRPIVGANDGVGTILCENTVIYITILIS